jgi:hypothetical protein
VIRKGIARPCGRRTSAIDDVSWMCASSTPFAQSSPAGGVGVGVPVGVGVAVTVAVGVTVGVLVASDASVHVGGGVGVAVAVAVAVGRRRSQVRLVDSPLPRRRGLYEEGSIDGKYGGP